jgi:hypothetical protein
MPAAFLYTCFGIGGKIMLHEEMLHAGLSAGGKQAFEINGAFTYGHNFSFFIEVLHMPERETPRVLVKQRNRVRTAFDALGEIQFHFYFRWKLPEELKK